MESQDRDSTMRSKKNNELYEMNTGKVLTHETYDPYLVNNC